MTTIQKLRLLEQIRRENERRLAAAGLTKRGGST